MSGVPGTCVIQVTNLSPAVTSEQMRTLFAFLGDVEELRLYPPDNAPLPFSSKLGIPIGNLGTLQAGLDPSLAALGGISSQPPLMGNVDPSKIDEIRRTVYVGNLNSQTTTAEQLLEYFKQVGDVKFVRMAGDETQPTRFAFVEFADQESVPRALTFNGVVFGDRPLKINHSNNAIVKPPEMTAQAAAKELEDVMKRVREAQSCISAAIEPVESGKSSTTSSKKAGRSRSRSQSKRKRSRSRHRIKKEERKEKIRERSRERNERERSPSRKKSSKDKEKLEKNTPVKVERDSDKEEKEYGSDKDSIHTNHLDHIKGQQNGSYNNHEEDLLVQTEVSE
ncbi:UNVERIFIED_CONTAM: hypothetical protein FKN15_019896 [Acipenser sinensis]